jgi:hypothetical protein
LGPKNGPKKISGASLGLQKPPKLDFAGENRDFACGAVDLVGGSVFSVKK